jgi:tetratricopeptide (TPR) repeat protein
MISTAIQEKYLMARKLFERENYTEAEPLLREVAEAAPFFADVFNKLGFIYHQEGGFGKAAKYFRKALEINPAYTEASLSLAVTLNNLGKYDEAREIFQKASRFAQPGPNALDPYVKGKLANMHADLASTYHDLGMAPEAIEEYRKALNLGPEFADLRTRMACAMRDLGRYEEAVAELQKAVRARPDFIPGYIQLGITYYLRGLIDLAVTEWEKALSHKPDDKSIQVYLGFMRKKKKEK